ALPFGAGHFVPPAIGSGGKLSPAPPFDSFIFIFFNQLQASHSGTRRALLKPDLGQNTAKSGVDVNTKMYKAANGNERQVATFARRAGLLVALAFVASLSFGQSASVDQRSNDPHNGMR